MSTFKLDQFITASDTATTIKTAQASGLLPSLWGSMRHGAVALNVAMIGLEVTTIGAVVKTLDGIEDSILGNKPTTVVTEESTTTDTTAASQPAGKK